jgi:uncharacterized Zn finger protein
MKCPNCHDSHVRTVAIVANADKCSAQMQCTNCGHTWNSSAPIVNASVTL